MGGWEAALYLSVILYLPLSRADCMSSSEGTCHDVDVQ